MDKDTTKEMGAEPTPEEVAERLRTAVLELSLDGLELVGVLSDAIYLTSSFQLDLMDLLGITPPTWPKVRRDRPSGTAA